MLFQMFLKFKFNFAAETMPCTQLIYLEMFSKFGRIEEFLNGLLIWRPPFGNALP